MRIAFAQFVDGLLVADHAAHHGDQQIAAFRLGVFQQRELVMRLLLRRLAHAARIEYDEVGLLHTRLFPAHFVEERLDALRVRLVHLAPHRPDMILPSRNAGSRCGHRIASLKPCDKRIWFYRCLNWNTKHYRF